PKIRAALRPVCGQDDAAPQEVEFEAVLARIDINRLLFSREQIEQERPESIGFQKLGDRAIPAAESTAAASVRDNHEARRALGYAQIGANLSGVTMYVARASPRCELCAQITARASPDVWRTCASSAFERLHHVRITQIPRQH